MGFLSALVGGGLGFGVQVFSNYATKIPISRSESFDRRFVVVVALAPWIVRSTAADACRIRAFLINSSFLCCPCRRFRLICSPLETYRTLASRRYVLGWVLRGKQVPQGRSQACAGRERTACLPRYAAFGGFQCLDPLPTAR